MQWEQLKEKYSRYIISPQKKPETIVSFVKAKVDCMELPIYTQSSFFCHAIKENVLSSVLNRNNYASDDLVFQCYQIKKNEKSAGYYSELDGENNVITVIIEMCTGYIYCDCSKLFLELAIERGIDREDLELNNDFCKAYLSYIHHFLENDE